MSHQVAACAAENGAPGEDLGANSGGLAIARQASCALKFRESESRLKSSRTARNAASVAKNCFQAEAIRSQVVLQFQMLRTCDSVSITG
jgi:hypothetical protein